MVDWDTALEIIQDSLLKLEVENVMEYWRKRIDEIYLTMERSVIERWG